MQTPESVFTLRSPGGRSTGTKTHHKNLQSLRNLKRSNFLLERILSEQRAKEVQLESNCRLLEESLKQNKQQTLKQNVKDIAGNLFLLLVCLLLWGNWMMFSPHLDGIVMALLVSAASSDFQLRLIDLLDQFKISTPFLSRILPVFLIMQTGLLLCFHYAVHFCGSNVNVAWFAEGSFLVCAVLVLTVRFTHSRTVTAVMITSMAISLGCVLPSALILNSFSQEADTVRNMFDFLLRDDQDMKLRINALFSGFQWFDAEKDIGKIQEWARNNVYSVFLNVDSVLGVATHFSNGMWALGTFAATLFSLLQLDRQHIFETCRAYSPFNGEDNKDIYETVKQSTWEVFIGSALIGLTNGFITYASLWMVSSPLLALPAIAASVLAVMPLCGSYIALSPFVLGFHFTHQPLKSLFLIIVHVLTTFVVNPLVLNVWVVQHTKTTGARFMGGLPVVAGLYAFGWCGILYGPLLVGLSGLCAKIYSRALLHNRSSDSACGGDDSLLD